MKLFSVLSLLSLLVVSSCGGDKTPEERAADSLRVIHEIIIRDSSELAAIPEPDTSGTGDWTANTRSGKHEVLEAALLADIRTSSNPKFDRIVFSFRSAQMPNWRISYADKADVMECGSGAPVTLEGKSWMTINFEPCNAHDTAGHPSTPWREQKFTHRTLREMKIFCDFEAMTGVVAGLRNTAKYRVLELKDPTRLVVDLLNE